MSPEAIERGLTAWICAHAPVLPYLTQMPKAVERYNGQGPKARAYKKEVVSEAIRMAQEIGE